MRKLPGSIPQPLHSSSRRLSTPTLLSQCCCKLLPDILCFPSRCTLHPAFCFKRLSWMDYINENHSFFWGSPLCKTAPSSQPLGLTGGHDRAVGSRVLQRYDFSTLLQLLCKFPFIKLSPNYPHLTVPSFPARTLNDRYLFVLQAIVFIGSVRKGLYSPKI